jgi:DNA replication regulator DPB11
MTICSTAFSGVDLLHVSKVIRLAGAAYEEYLSPQVSVLVCNSAAPSKKLRHALSWNVPAVRAEWLWDSVTAGYRKPFDTYLVSKTSTEHTIPRQPKAFPGAAEPGNEVALDEHDTSTPTHQKKLSVSSLEDGPTIEEAARRASKGRMKPPESEKCNAQLRDDGAVHQPQARAPPKPGKRSPARRSPGHPTPDNNLTATNTKPASRLSTSMPHKQSPPETEDLTLTIASLLARKQSTSSNVPRPASFPDHPSAALTRRNAPARLLGRAPSAGSVSRAGSVDSFLQTPNGETAEMDDDDMAAHVAHAHGAPEGDTVLPEPSQKVTYDDQEAQEVRERLLRKFGGDSTYHREGIGKGRVQSIGVAKDLAAKGRLRVLR